MDFSEPGQPPAREVLILKPDATVDGGLTEVQGLFASPLADSGSPADRGGAVHGLMQDVPLTLPHCSSGRSDCSPTRRW